MVAVGLAIPSIAAAQAPASAPAAGDNTPVAAPAPQTTTPAPAAAVKEPTPPTVEKKKKPAWYELLQWSAFVDGYYAVNYNFPKPSQSSNNGPLAIRAFDDRIGFSLAWFALDLTYPTGGALGPVGATVNIRLGPASPQLALSDSLIGDPATNPGGIALAMQFMKQAFVTWQPTKSLTIDFGKFDTLYGAEVADSFANHNYTRGALYNMYQPFHHTGLRVSWAASDAFTVNFIAVNGWNNSVDNNTMKTFGIQFAYSGKAFSASAGYLVGPENAGNNEDFRHFIDVVATAEFDKLALAFNFDFLLDDQPGAGTTTAFGAMLSGSYSINDIWGVGLRGEFLSDPDGAYLGHVADTNLITATLTIDMNLGKYAVFRLDNRMDFATEGDGFSKGRGETQDFQITSTLGVVFKTN
jgi:hypothetical protein